MGAYVLRRLLIAIPTLLGVSFIVFVMLHTAGGDAAEVTLGSRADAESLAKLRHELGLDQPLPVQYFRFLGNALRGDLGVSYRSNTPVSEEVFNRLPATIELAVAAMLIAIVIGVALGVLAAIRRNSWVDLTTTVGALLGVSIPTFWLGLLLIVVFGLWLRWLPISGRVNPRLGADPSTPFLLASSVIHGDWRIARDAFAHLVLPAITLAAWPAAIIARMTQASLVEALSNDYIRTARAKGLAEPAIVRGQAARNAMLPVLTVIGLEFGALLGGAVVTEKVFAWPGLGQLTVNAIASRDYQLVMGVVLVLAAMFVILNTLTDLLYAWLDPRIRFR